MNAKQILEQTQATQEDLDELVIYVAQRLASSANNEGPAGQIRFLKESGGYEDVDIIQALKK